MSHKMTTTTTRGEKIDRCYPKRFTTGAFRVKSSGCAVCVNAPFNKEKGEIKYEKRPEENIE